jgi:putative endonuclease
MGTFVYILRCSDGSFYTGTTRNSLEIRVAEHNMGKHPGYTFDKRPVELAFSQYFDVIIDAIACEQQIKGWSRAKKQAIIEGKFELLPELSSRKKK